MATRLTLVQGKAWTIPMLWQDEDGKAIDCIGASCRMQLRRHWADDEPTTAPLLDLTETTGITLGDDTSTVDDPNVLTVVGATDTEAIPYGGYLAEWEIDFGAGPERLALLEIEVAPEVVREVVAP